MGSYDPFDIVLGAETPTRESQNALVRCPRHLPDAGEKGADKTDEEGIRDQHESLFLIWKASTTLSDVLRQSWPFRCFPCDPPLASALSWLELRQFDKID